MLLLARLSLVVASLLLVLALGEGLARLTAPDPPRVPVPVADVLPKLSRDDLARPNVRGTFRGVYYRTDRIGLRGPNRGALPDPDVFRIAIAGDSVTVGSAVLEEDAYPAVLERLLNERPGAERFEVLNLGLGGLNAHWVLERLERASRTYRFHLAVYGWTLNDIEGPSYQRLPIRRGIENYWARTRRFEQSRSYLLRALWPRWIAFQELIWPTVGDKDREVRFNYLENPDAWAAFEAELERFAAFTRKRGICGHVFLHTQLAKLDARHPMLDIYARVARAARAHGLSVTRSFPQHDGRAAADLWVSIYDSHPNVDGHRLLAESLYEGLQRDLPVSCWDPERGKRR